MSDVLLLREMYRQLLEINITAFAGKHYQVAYHALCGAMYAANDLGEDAKLAAVEQLAHEQNTWIETLDPQHPLAGHAAAQRGHRGIYAVLLAQLATMRRMLEKRPRHSNTD